MNAQRQVLAVAAGRARHLRLPQPLLARGASPEAAKPLCAANGVGRFLPKRETELFSPSLHEKH